MKTCKLTTETVILQAHQLSKTYREGSKRIPAVQGVSLQLAAGEVLAFLGPNGAGKTTTIKMIAGLIVPDTGSVAIAGADPYRQPQALQHLGAVLEGSRNLYWRLTPEENLEYFGVLRGLNRRLARQRGNVLLERFGLSDKRRTPTQGLSRGMQQKLAFAVALIHHPRLLLLDEPTLGLDVEATETVKALVREVAREEGRAILLTTHQLDVAEDLSDRVAIIRQGQIIAEEPTSELIRRFSGNTYTVVLEQPLDAERIAKLRHLGLDCSKPISETLLAPNQLQVTDPELLYPVLEILRPLPLVKVEKAQATLTDVFLQLVNSNF